MQEVRVGDEIFRFDQVFEFPNERIDGVVWMAHG